METKLIVWRKSALKQVAEILDFYEIEFSAQAVENLVEKIEAVLEKVSRHPTIGRPSAKKEEVRSWIVKKHYRLFYLTKGNQLVIVAFYDMRQNPAKRKY